jgi:16S rRNA (uracil1498-N3)-methyltransferase
MSYFLSRKNLTLHKEIEVEGEEAGHILLARRVKVGEKINLQGPNGKRFVSEVVKLNKKSLTVKALEETVVPQEPKVSVTLFQSFVSEKALDFIFQKGTELGLSKIVLFNSVNTATKVTKEMFNKKLERWNKILWEAAKQCDRGVIPEITFLQGLDDVMSLAKSFDKVLVMDILGQKLNVKGQILNAALVVGPEGGFTRSEVDQMKTLVNHQLVSFGSRMLRAETAALAALAVCSNLFEN